MSNKLVFAVIFGLLVVCPQVFAELEDEGYGGDGDEDYDGEDEYGEGGAGAGGQGPSEPAIAKHVKGIVDIDDVTFDKIVLGGRPTFVTFYSTEEDAGAQDVQFVIEEVAEKLGAHLKLVMAKIDVTGDDAALMRARFGNRKAPFHLFFPNGRAEPVEYKMDAEATDAAEKLEAWLVERTGHPFQVEAFAPLVDKFVAYPDQRPGLLSKAESLMADLTPAEAQLGKWFLKTMSSMMKKGDEYLPKEFKRLDKMISDHASMKADKIAEFTQRREVVNIFSGGKFKSSSE